MSEPTAKPTIAEVVSALAVDLDGQEATVDLVEIRRATDYQWMCKVHPAGGEDFESYVIRFKE